MRALSKYIGFAWDTVRHQGLRHSVGDVMAELAFDWRHGVETMVPRELESLDIEAPSIGDGVQYQGANPRLVRNILEALPPEARSAEFVDFGCGKGRVMLLAAEMGFEKLTGIEFSPHLAEFARGNLSKSRRMGQTVEHTVLTMDATEYVVPETPVVLFFYNPFGGETLRRVVMNIRRRLAQQPRDLWVVYVNPKGLAVFSQTGMKAIYSERRRERLMGVILSA